MHKINARSTHCFKHKEAPPKVFLPAGHRNVYGIDLLTLQLFRECAVVSDDNYVRDRNPLRRRNPIQNDISVILIPEN